MSCDNAPAGSQLASACACQNASAALATSLTQYGTDFSNYTTAVAKHNSDHSAWKQRRDAKKQALADEDSYRGCGACGSNAGCQGGYRWERNANGCGFANMGCEQVCRRNNDQVERDMSGWYSQNPEPTLNSTKPTPPSGSNIQCCSQLFSNITADSANFSNISQQCSQQIASQIASAGSSGGSGGSGGSGDKKSKTTLYIVIGVVTCMSILLVLAMFMMEGDDE
jgi:hypothetical protein